jgi:hypothetical protein
VDRSNADGLSLIAVLRAAPAALAATASARRVDLREHPERGVRCIRRAPSPAALQEHPASVPALASVPEWELVPASVSAPVWVEVREALFRLLVRLRGHSVRVRMPVAAASSTRRPRKAR